MRQYRFQAPREPLSPGRSVAGPVRTRALRPLAGLALAGLLMGCAPTAVMIASQAADGVSYLTTGKSTTDHLLSTALDEDCALHRVISGVAVCQDDRPVQTASLAGTPVIGDDAVEAGDDDTTPAQQAAATTGQPSVPRPAAAGHGAPAGAGLGADMFFVPYNDGDAPAAERHAENMPATRPDDGAAPPAPPPIPDAAVPNATAVATPITAPATTAAPETASPVAPRYFIVLGSFAHKAYAERAARAVTGTDGTRVVEVKLSGRTFYRVVAGPFDRPGTLAARRRYAGAGYGSAWPVPACDGDTVGTGCIATR